MEPRLEVVEVYPCVLYVQYLLPGSTVMSIFMMVMIGGGISSSTTREVCTRGIWSHPSTKLKLISGFNFSGTVKAVLAGSVLMTIGAIIAGIPNPFEPLKMFRVGVCGDRHRVACTGQHDVLADAPCQRSAAVARDVRRSQYIFVFSKRRGLPAFRWKRFRYGCR